MHVVGPVGRSKVWVLEYQSALKNRFKRVSYVLSIAYHGSSFPKRRFMKRRQKKKNRWK